MADQAGEDCLATVQGQEYKGKVNITRSGKVCQSWVQTTPHMHKFTWRSGFPDGSPAESSNYCRSPTSGKTQGPWCFTMDADVPWQYCSVPLCRNGE